MSDEDQPDEDPDLGPHIYGLEARALREGAVPLEAIALIRTLESDGSQGMAVRVTSGLLLTDKLGMLNAAAELTKVEVIEAYTPRRDDD